MGKGRIFRFILIGVASVILLGSIGLSAFLCYSNYQNVQLFRSAENNFAKGDADSLENAEAQLKALIAHDSDHERAFVLLGKIAARKKNVPEQLHYSFQAHKLNPLSAENEKAYIESLIYAREFQRLETFLAHKSELTEELSGLLLYAAGQNGNMGKYEFKQKFGKDNLMADLALLLYKHKHLGAKQKLALLKSFMEKRASTDFHKQEIAAAQAHICLLVNDVEGAEKYLFQAYKLNEFAFAPPMGRFYANYRSLGKGSAVFEKYLNHYHDPAVVLQYAELCCLLKKRDKLADLKLQYQEDTGENAMLLYYYLEVLEHFSAGNLKALRQYLIPLQKVINTPLASFIYLCAELDSGSTAGVLKYYNALIEHRTYLDLQLRADQLVLDFIKGELSSQQIRSPLFMELVNRSYRRRPDSTTGKILFLTQRKNGNSNMNFVSDLMKRFPNDRGVRKIAAEYYLVHDPDMAEKVIDDYEKEFPEFKKDMLRYKILLAWTRGEEEKGSRLFRENFSKAIAGEFWRFAMNTRRKEDLRFLAKFPPYGPFCNAALLMIDGKKEKALNLLASADARGNLDLLFYAAKTLAENNREKEALKLYAKFPEKSSYQLDVLLNCSELHWSLGNKNKSLRLAQRAYEMAPGRSETQFCYADKLYKSGNLSRITEVVTLTGTSRFQAPLRRFLTAGLEHRLKTSNLQWDGEKILRFCDRLLRLDPENKTALQYRAKVMRLMKNDSGRKE